MKKPFIVYAESFEALRKDCKEAGLDLCYKFIYTLKFRGFSMKEKIFKRVEDLAENFQVVKYEGLGGTIPKHRLTFYSVSDSQEEKLSEFLEKTKHMYKTLDLVLKE